MIFLCRENNFSFPSTREFCLRVWSFILPFLNRCTTSLLQILIKTFHDCILMLQKWLHTSVVLLKVFIVILFCFLFSFTYFQISDKIHFLKKKSKVVSGAFTWLPILLQCQWEIRNSKTLHEANNDPYLFIFKNSSLLFFLYSGLLSDTKPVTPT